MSTGRHMKGVREPYEVTIGGDLYYRTDIVAGRYPNGRTKYKTFTSKSKTECQRKAREYERQIIKYGHALDARTTLGEMTESWLSLKREQVKFKTYEGYESLVRRHLKDHLATPLIQFTPSGLQRIVNDMSSHDQRGRRDGDAGSSLRRKLCSTLNQIFALAVKEGRLDRNPAEGLELGVSRDVIAREARNERRAFTVPEMNAMLATAARWGLRDGTRMWFRLLTGMRQGEILGARREDLRLFDATTMVPRTVRKPTEVRFVDDDGVERVGTIMTDVTENMETKVLVGEYAVNWQLQPVPREHGCTGAEMGRPSCGKRKPGNCPKAKWRMPKGTDFIPVEGSMCLVTPKSHTGDRVPIIPMLATVLKDYIKDMRGVPDPHGLLFRHDDGTPILNKEDTDDFNRLMRESGIDPETHTGHETRNSVVTLLAAQGVDMQLIQEIVRHSNVAMTQHYRKAGDMERLAAMEKLEAGLNLKGIGWKEQ